MPQFAPQLAQLFLGRGIHAAGLSVAHAITIYSGTKPSAADITANFAASYNSAAANFLVHYSGAIWTQSTYIMTLTTIPAAVNASHSGTASWVILWGANPLLAAMNAGLPHANFVVADVTDAAGDGVIRFANPALVAGVGAVILDGAIGAVML